MPTARLILDRVEAYPGVARVYQLSPPLLYDGQEREYVLVWVAKYKPGRDCKVSVIPSSSTGAIIEQSMRARPGSFVAHANPHSTPEALEGAFQWALATAGQAFLPGPTGGYTIVEEP